MTRHPSHRPVYFSLLAISILSSSVQAGVARQGKDVQGTALQGARLGGAAAPASTASRSWLQGERLIGWLPRPTGRVTQGVIELVGFHGDEILALSRNGRHSWQPVRLAPADLVGMTWLEHDCQSSANACLRVVYRIVGVARDTTRNTMPRYSDNSDIWLYDIEYATTPDPRPQDWRHVCRTDHRGVASGLFVDGRYGPDGSWRSGGYTFACTDGVIAKCARSWGYKPWARLPSSLQRVIDMRPLHLACTRAARADYCGDGRSHTRDGTAIDLFDIHGFNVWDAPPDFSEEAGFSRAGATWVTRPRVAEDDGDTSAVPTCRGSQRMDSSNDASAVLHVWSWNPQR